MIENDLPNTKELVRSILEKSEQCRNSDSFLYFAVLKAVGDRKGLDIDSMSIPYFMLNLHGTAFPGFETVRRARQKLQAEYPHLRASDAVEGFRADNEKAFREFAREVNPDG